MRSGKSGNIAYGHINQLKQNVVQLNGHLPVRTKVNAQRTIIWIFTPQKLQKKSVRRRLPVWECKKSLERLLKKNCE